MELHSSWRRATSFCGMMFKLGACRLCDPYITSSLVSDLFGELAGQAVVTYLIPTGTDRFELRPEYSRYAVQHSLAQLLHLASLECPTCEAVVFW